MRSHRTSISRKYIYATTRPAGRNYTCVECKKPLYKGEDITKVYKSNAKPLEFCIQCEVVNE